MNKKDYSNNSLKRSRIDTIHNQVNPQDTNDNIKKHSRTEDTFTIKTE